MSVRRVLGLPDAVPSCSDEPSLDEPLAWSLSYAASDSMPAPHGLRLGATQDQELMSVGDGLERVKRQCATSRLG